MKANRVKSLFQSLLYLLIAIVALLGISFIAGSIISAILLLTNDYNITDMQNELVRIVNDSNVRMIITLVFFEVLLIVFIPWYLHSSKKEVKYPIRGAMTRTNLFMAVLIGFFMQFVINAVIVVIYLITPKWIENYTNMVDTVFSKDSSLFLLIIYAVIIGPVAEELLFRGMIYRVLRKGFSVYSAAAIASLMFAVYHMNVVQGIYTFFVGFLLCILYEKTKTFWYTSVVHMVFNGASFVLGWIAEQYGEMSGIYTIILWILSCGIVMNAIRRISYNKCIAENTESQS